MMRPRATLLRVPENSSRAMARCGRARCCRKSSDVNSEWPLTGTVLAARFWEIRSYEEAELLRLRGRVSRTGTKNASGERGLLFEEPELKADHEQSEVDDGPSLRAAEASR